MKIDALSNDVRDIAAQINIDTYDILTLKVVSRSAKEKTLLELNIYLPYLKSKFGDKAIIDSIDFQNESLKNLNFSGWIEGYGMTVFSMQYIANTFMFVDESKGHIAFSWDILAKSRVDDLYKIYKVSRLPANTKQPSIEDVANLLQRTNEGKTVSNIEIICIFKYTEELTYGIPFIYYLDNERKVYQGAMQFKDNQWNFQGRG
jgi:hypothetical protein